MVDPITMRRFYEIGYEFGRTNDLLFTALMVIWLGFIISLLVLVLTPRQP